MHRSRVWKRKLGGRCLDFPGSKDAFDHQRDQKIPLQFQAFEKVMSPVVV
jgi:hypothetical protein